MRWPTRWVKGPPGTCGSGCDRLPAVSPKAPDSPVSSASGLRCDFCHEQVASVRRVALDEDYERLRTPHRELYACPACSDRKEQERRGVPPRQR